MTHSESNSDAPEQEEGGTPEGNQGHGSGDASTNEPWYRRLGKKSYAALGALILLLVTALVSPIQDKAKEILCDKFDTLCPTRFRIEVSVDTDKMDPDGKGFEGAYVTQKKVDSLPKPPNNRNSCNGRYEWAHGKIGAVDALTTEAQIDVTALNGGGVTVEGFKLHRDSKKPSLQGSLLTCPGKGGGERKAHQVNVDLDAGSVALQSEEKNTGITFVDVDESKTESFSITASAINCDCRWRLEVYLLVDGKRENVTVGPRGVVKGSPEENPAQTSFETTGADASNSYFLVNGRWRRQDPSDDLPPPPKVCKLLPQSAVDTALHGHSPAEPGERPLPKGHPKLPHPTGASGLPASTQTCVWERGNSQPDLGLMNLNLVTLADSRAAHLELSAFAKDLKENTPGSTITPLTGFGDEAFELPGWIASVRGNKVLEITGSHGKSDVDPLILQRLARIALEKDW